jgi:hypothetical protein
MHRGHAIAQRVRRAKNKLRFLRNGPFDSIHFGLLIANEARVNTIIDQPIESHAPKVFYRRGRKPVDIVAETGLIE